MSLIAMYSCEPHAQFFLRELTKPSLPVNSPHIEDPHFLFKPNCTIKGEESQGLCSLRSQGNGHWSLVIGH
jgi:hypothetical protein